MIERLLAFLILMLTAGTLWLACGSPTAPSSCTAGPYTYDSNPNVQRCRAANGQFAENACCGR